MAATSAIKAAIKADLEDINGTGIFTTVLAEVGTEPKRYDAMSKPAVFVLRGEGEDEEQALGGNTERSASQDYVLLCATHSATCYEDMDTLLDDIRNSLQRSSSSTLSIAETNYTVQDIKVSWNQTFTEPGIDEGGALAEVNVSVIYRFNAGSV